MVRLGHEKNDSISGIGAVAHQSRHWLQSERRHHRDTASDNEPAIHQHGRGPNERAGPPLTMSCVDMNTRCPTSGAAGRTRSACFKILLI
jgi:hypothetical protein